MKKVEKIAVQFDIKGRLIEIKELSGGNINSTYLLTFYGNGKLNKYIFQKINTTVFKEPYVLMERIKRVTEHMKRQQTNGAQVLQVINTIDGKNLYTNEENGVEHWRVYEEIKNAISYNDMSEVPTDVKDDVPYIIGQAFGNFLRLVSDYPEDGLSDPIINFHNTEYIYHEFIKDVRDDKHNRAHNCVDEINFVTKRASLYSHLNDLVRIGEIPKRLNHNDTKINNVLICWENENTSVIDLDTVMHGVLSDPADALRSLINEAGEEEFELQKIDINFDILKAFIQGYASETYETFNDVEIENIGNALHIITLELGMRFLKDHLNGDVYFRVNPKIKDHNLQRARVQFELAKKIELNKEYIDQIIITTYEKTKKQKLGRKLELKRGDN